ncbi:hypothetical protein DPMN_110633 [Dreissena polymorpha]|uniref:Uncharacterized protein n=1 Tax=Dreissena polymorpha TaxID=45954 RepID=A0A9D4KDC5_DREPO|nr:hypothetical protein DPMN_110633 [Dreissena polymorpha]
MMNNSVQNTMYVDDCTAMKIQSHFPFLRGVVCREETNLMRLTRICRGRIRLVSVNETNILLIGLALPPQGQSAKLKVTFFHYKFNGY